MMAVLSTDSTIHNLQKMTGTRAVILSFGCSLKLPGAKFRTLMLGQPKPITLESLQARPRHQYC